MSANKALIWSNNAVQSPEVFGLVIWFSTRQGFVWLEQGTAMEMLFRFLKQIPRSSSRPLNIWDAKLQSIKTKKI